jgi:hypothetical protein
VVKGVYLKASMRRKIVLRWSFTKPGHPEVVNQNIEIDLWPALSQNGDRWFACLFPERSGCSGWAIPLPTYFDCQKR